MKITVKIFENGEEVLSRILGEGAHRIGRSEFCDLVLKGDQVSRSHIELRVTESNVYMTNMSSGGRVKVNNERVETTEIKEGDEIQIGSYKIYVFHGERDLPEQKGLVGVGKASAEPPLEGVNEKEELNFKLQDDPQENLPAQVSEEAKQLLQEAPAEEYKNQEEYKAEVISMPLPPPPSNDVYLVEGTAALQKAETVIEAKPMVARLVFIEGVKAGDELPLEAYEVTFGRSKKADIFVDDVKLSRKHCKIARVGMGYRLIDLGSRNGTFVNGMRVLEHPLSSFDLIEIGDTKMKFLIVDLAMGDMAKGALAPVEGAKPNDTASLHFDSDEDLLESQRLQAIASDKLGPSELLSPPTRTSFPVAESRSKTGLYIVAIFLLIALYFLIPQKNQNNGLEKATNSMGSSETVPQGMKPLLPKEYGELSTDLQRSIEGHYNASLKAGNEGRFEEAVTHLKSIHESIPFYKNSRDLLEQYGKKFKEQQIAAAQAKAERDQRADLSLYLEEGLQYLKESDFDRAAEAFNSAILLDPKNDTALKGLRAADLKVKDLTKLPPEVDSEEAKKKEVTDLFQSAVVAFSNKEYQKAIELAESIRKIEMKGDTQYLNEAKQIIDRAKLMQKEEFEPFLIDAKSRYAEGDYAASRDLCEEMLKRDAAYEEAKDCVLKAKKQLNRLAKEAYTHGYILESMNRIEEAKQYWTRAKNYVRPGDDYFDKISKKLEHYQ